MKKRKAFGQKIDYIEVTEKRYNHVVTSFKYKCLDNDGNTHYYLARNRRTLDDKLEEIN